MARLVHVDQDIGKLSTHSGRLERWLGPQAEVLSAVGRDWYGPPIPIIGVPGKVYLRGGPGGGDFVGRIEGGYFGNLYDFARQRIRAALRRTARRQFCTASMGFASLGDLIAEASAGKKRVFVYQKLGGQGVVGGSNTVWYRGSTPPTGATAGGVPAGSVCDDTTTGSFAFTNPAAPDTQHLTRWDSSSSVAATTLMLYDRLYAVEATMNDNTAQAVTGVPSRYQSTTGTDPDYVGGNFLFVECREALPATDHNWTVCTYKDQDDAASTLPSVAGVASCGAHRLDLPVGYWFAPLEAGDVGIKALTQLQCSAAVAGGNIAFAIGHPLGILAHPLANLFWSLDGVTGAFNLNRVFDNACLAFLELAKPGTGTTAYTGLFETVSG